jgi:hypothetical protein
MAIKAKVSEWDSVASNNVLINGININEHCPPSAVNNAIREMMAQIKDWQSGSSGDDWTSSGVLNITGSLKLDGELGTAGQVLVSQGSSATPTWGDAFVRGMIMIWHGSSVDSIPSGWALCNGANGTPDLRNRFIMGAGDRPIDYSPGRLGGSADTPLVAHYHDGGTSYEHLTGRISQQGNRAGIGEVDGSIFSFSGHTSYAGNTGAGACPLHITLDASHSHTFRTEVKGESGTNKNLPPYYTLAYIMKL